MANFLLRQLWLVCLICPLIGTSQTKTSKNTFNVGISSLNFMDGYGYLTTQYWGLELKSWGYYLEYERKLGDKYAILAGTGYFTYQNYNIIRGYTDKSQLNKYDLGGRGMKFYNLGVKHYLKTLEKPKFQLNLGLLLLFSYQTTSETFLLYHYPSGFDVNVAGVSGNRFGITPGINGSITVFKHLNIGANFMFTHFFKDLKYKDPSNGDFYAAYKNYFLFTPMVGVKF